MRKFSITRTVFGVLLLGSLAGTRLSFAGEQEASLRVWTRACLEALRSENPQVRQSARAALTYYDTRSMGVLVEEILNAPTVAWGELKLVAQASPVAWGGTLEVALRAKGGARSPELQALLETSKKESRDAEALFAGVDPGVAAILRKIPATSQSVSLQHPVVWELAALGRKSAESIGAAVRRCEDADQRGRSSAGAAALMHLFDSEVAPVVERLLADGYGVAATALFGADAALSAPLLAGAIDKDVFSVEVMMAVARSKPSPLLARALNAWIKRHASDEDPYNVISALELTGSVGDEESHRIILGMSPKPWLDPARGWKMDAALVRLGDPEAVDRVAERILSPTLERRQIIDALNAAFGAALPNEIRASISADRDGSNGESSTYSAFGVWWKGVRAKAVFDWSVREWRVK